MNWWSISGTANNVFSKEFAIFMKKINVITIICLNYSTKRETCIAKAWSLKYVAYMLSLHAYACKCKLNRKGKHIHTVQWSKNIRQQYKRFKGKKEKLDKHKSLRHTFWDDFSESGAKLCIYNLKIGVFPHRIGNITWLRGFKFVNTRVTARVQKYAPYEWIQIW